MSRKTNGVHYGKTVKQKSRRERVIGMLERQLKSGIKTSKSGLHGVNLEESDIKRINKEISTLKSRV